MTLGTLGALGDKYFSRFEAKAVSEVMKYQLGQYKGG